MYDDNELTQNEEITQKKPDASNPIKIQDPESSSGNLFIDTGSSSNKLSKSSQVIKRKIVLNYSDLHRMSVQNRNRDSEFDNFGETPNLTSEEEDSLISL